MKPNLPDQIALAVKDQLRAARQDIRRRANGSGGADLPAQLMPRPVAIAADAVFSQMEAAATAFAPATDSGAGPLALPVQFLRTFKDQLRTVRYQIRRRAHGNTERVAEPSELVPRPVAIAAETVIAQVEAAAAALRPEHDDPSLAFAFPQPVSHYFGAETTEAGALTPEIYYALKALLSRFGSETHLVSEQAVHEAVELVVERGAEMVTQALDASESAEARYGAAVRLSASLAIALAAKRPIREVAANPQRQGTPKHLLVAPNEYCALVIGLAIALASRPDLAGVEAEALIDSADFAVDARFAELSAAIRGRQAAAAVEAEFKAILPFLP